MPTYKGLTLFVKPVANFFSHYIWWVPGGYLRKNLMKKTATIFMLCRVTSLGVTKPPSAPHEGPYSGKSGPPGALPYM